MSETTAYLIPKKHFEVGNFSTKVQTVFERLKLINGYYDQDHNWYNAGNNAYQLFVDVSLDNNPPFEFLEIHDTENNRLLPEGLQEVVECRICQTNLKEDLDDLLFRISEKEYDENSETDMATVELVCSMCGQKSKLVDLSYHEKITITNQYICFMAIPANLNEDKLAEIEVQLNTPFDIIYGSI